MRKVAPALLAVGALVLGLGLGAPARADGEKQNSSGLVLRNLDSTDPSKVTATFEYAGDPADVPGIRVAEDGDQVQLDNPPVAVPAAERGVMFVVDSSKSTDTSAILAETQEAVRVLAAALPGVPIGLMSAGAEARLEQRFSTDLAKFEQALVSVNPLGDGAVWEAIERAVAQFSGEDMLPTIVVITDGDLPQAALFAQAEASVLNSGAQVHVVGVQKGGLGPESRGLAERSGGAYLETGNPADLADVLKQLTPKLAGQYRLTYASGAESGLTTLDLTVGGASSRNSFVPGSVIRGVNALAYQETSSGGGFALFNTTLAKYLGVLLALAAAGLGAHSLIGIAVKDENALAQVLRPYDGYSTLSIEEQSDGDQSFAQSALIQRAVNLTEQFAQRQGFLTKVESALERANLPIRAAEAMFFYAAAAGILTLLVLVLTRQLLMAGIALLVVALLPPAIISFLAGRRKRQFEAQLPDMLQLMSATLRAGYSMQQAIDAVSQEVAEPMGRELRRATTEARLGRPLEESLDAIAERMASADFAWAVMAIRIQREVGGNLAELLMTVGETMTQRERLRREVKALTAEGRMSAYVLGILPIALAGILWAINPEYMQPLLDETLGNVLLGASVVGMVGGFAWMTKIVKIEI